MSSARVSSMAALPIIAASAGSADLVGIADQPRDVAAHQVINGAAGKQPLGAVDHVGRHA